MKKLIVLLGAIAVLTSVATAKALMIAPPPLPMRVAAADAVVIGKVTEIGEKAEKAEMFKGDAREMKITTIKVEEGVLGSKAKTIKVAYYLRPQVKGGGVPIRPGIGRGGIELSKDQDGMFLLTKHPTKKDLYVVQGMFDFVVKTGNPNFKTEADQARNAAKLLADPMKGFNSKDAEVRLETTALLLTRYRTASGTNTKTESAPADISKKILTTLAEADWNAPGNPRNYMMNPQTLFFRLGLTAKDGWNQPRNFQEMKDEAKKWLKDNASKYRVQRYVREGDKKTIEPEPE